MDVWHGVGRCVVSTRTIGRGLVSSAIGVAVAVVVFVTLVFCFFTRRLRTAPPPLFQGGSRGRASPEDGSGREAPPSDAAGMGVQVRDGRGGRATEGARLAAVAREAG